jgi:GAF domain-containing protein
VTGGRLVGKFMVDYDAPHVFSADEVQPGRAIVAQIAFAIERHRAEEMLQASAERLRFALEAGNVATRDTGTWTPIGWPSPTRPPPFWSWSIRTTAPR